jgi:glycosyltransferase involved in cell wall biosynthesis
MAGRVMKVLYDHQIFSGQKFGGISRYFYELMKHSDGLFDYETSGLFSENEYVKPLQIYREFPVKCSFRGKQRIINRLNRIDSIRKIKRGDYDVLHPTYYDPYVLREKTKPLVVTIHDMIHELFPDYFYDDRITVKNKKNILMRADRIIAISDNTKRDLLKLYPKIDKDKVVVIYHGILSSISENNEKKENYLLYTGQRDGYKNFDNFINAIAPLLIQYDLQLICTGKTFSKKEARLLNDLKIGDRVISRFVADDRLPGVYAKSLAFVFPSLYEGFGIPILEAFVAGCPVVLSNTSCFPEIAGNAAFYFDPYSIEDMRSVIEKVITSPALQSDLINRGRERIKKYSWEKCAEETAKVYRELDGTK